MVSSILSESSVILNSTQTSTLHLKLCMVFQIPVCLSITTRVNTASQHVVHYIFSMSLHLDFMLLTVVPAAVTDIFYKSIHDSLNTSAPVNVSLQWIVSREAITLHTCVISAFDIICFLATGANSSQSPQLHCSAQYHS